MDLLLHCTQSSLIRVALLTGDGVADLAIVERGLDFVDVFVEKLLRFLLEGYEQRLVHVLLHPAVIEILACPHQEIGPARLLLGIDPRVALDGILQTEQHVHRGEALGIRLADRRRQRIDHESWRYAGKAFLGQAFAQPLGVGAVDAVDVFAPLKANALAQVGALVVAAVQPGQDGEHGGSVQHVRVEMHLAERRFSRRDELAIDHRLGAIVERVRNLDHHHPVEQRFVLRFLQELPELCEVGVRDNGFVDVDQREPRHLDVLFLSQSEQQVKELALYLQDLNHFEHAAARGVHRARPGPGARVAFVAEFRNLRQIDRADEICEIGGCGIVRRVRADAHATCLSNKYALDRHAHVVSTELLIDAHPAGWTQVAGDVGTIGVAERSAQRLRYEMQR